MVQGGMSLIKYILAFFNFLFVICGITMMALGGYIQYAVAKYNLTTSNLTAAPSLLIAVGVFIFLLSFLGCCGALKENHAMIITFSVLLTLILILEAAAMIAGFMFRNEIESTLKGAMEDSIPKYAENEKTRGIWDATQHDFECCGVSNYTDWLNNNLTIPGSCCKAAHNDTCTTIEAYEKGCFDKVERFFVKNAITIGCVALAIALIELLGIICGCYLARSIRQQYEMV